MLARLRDALYRVIVTPRGDTLTPIRVPKDLARRLNTALGRPFAPEAELKRRAAARARLKDLRANAAESHPVVAEPAPVLVYFEGGRNMRELTRIEELLGAQAIACKRLDVSGDEATIDFVTRQAHCDRDDLPVVFVAERVIGTYEALVRADVSGELKRLVSGAASTSS